MIWLIALAACEPSPSRPVSEPADPTADSDDDGYRDVWEEAEGSDPRDPSSRIYIGGYPYNPDKASIVASDADRYEVGDVIRDVRFRRDRFDERVHLHDFARQGRPVVLHLLAQWCGPCHLLSEYAAGAPSPYFQGDLAYRIRAGDVIWIEVMVELSGPGSVPTSRDLEDYHAAAGHPWVVPIVHADADRLAPFGLGAWPRLVLVDQDMRIQAHHHDFQDTLAVVEAL